MNVRLYDGTVRCPACFDASSYRSETSDPCLYCSATPLDSEPTAETQSDTEWLDTLATLVIEPATRYRTITKRQCERCPNPAPWKIVDGIGDDTYTCTDHGQEWYPELFPLVNS